MSLLTIEEPQQQATRRSPITEHPVLQLGFRPFYFLAAVFSAIAVPLWIARFYGFLPVLERVTLNWHMHEMVFGFATAVIVGFLYTAGRNWTGLWTPRRGHLLALVLLWLAGRVALLFVHPWIAALVDLAFIPFAAWPLYRVLQRAGNRRNLFLVALLGFLTMSNAVFHAVNLGWLHWSASTPVYAAILTIVLIESVIGGRVIPGFTGNAVPGVKPVMHVKRDKIALAVTVLASLAWVVGLPAPLTASLAFAASFAQASRLIGWQPHRTLAQPLLWILHVSYAWIPAGFLLLALAALNLVSSSAAFHALAVGSMAGLIIGMITRTALGHTGRQLKAGRSEQVMYLLIQAGVIARVAAAVAPGEWYAEMLSVATFSWCAAFLLYAVVYGPYLFRARIDGREG